MILDSAINQLPEFYRLLLRLKHEDLTCEEMGYVLSRHTADIRRRLTAVTEVLATVLSATCAPIDHETMREALEQVNWDAVAPIPEEIDETVRRRLQEYVEQNADLVQMPDPELRMCLSSSAAARLYTVLLEREVIRAECDVIGHSAQQPGMPTSMMTNLMQHVTARRDQAN